MDEAGRRVVSIDDIAVTETALERTRGLLNRDLEKRRGLFISPCNSVHTFGMAYALDLIYLDRHNRVIKVREQVRPRRLSASLRAYGVLELKAGMARALGVKQDMRIDWLD